MVEIISYRFDPAALEASAKRRKTAENWAANRRARLASEAETRLVRLNADTYGIQRAQTLYADLDGVGEITEIRIRVPFVRLNPPRAIDRSRTRDNDIATRPPATQLIAAAGSRALSTYLTILFVAQMRREMGGKTFTNRRPNVYKNDEGQPWAELAGFDRTRDPNIAATQRQRQTRKALTTALDALSEARLVTLQGKKGVKGRYDRFLVQSDGANSKAPYRVPGEGAKNKDIVRLPESFFRNGWHLVLSPSELAVLLAVIDRTNQFSQREPKHGLLDLGIDLKDSVRRGVYGLSGEAYEAIHMLQDCGLIEVVDPMLNRFAQPADDGGAPGSGGSDGEEQRLAYRLIYPPRSENEVNDPFARSALTVVREVLTARINNAPATESPS